MQQSRWLKVIAWSQIIGGAAGLVLLPIAFLQQRTLGISEQLRVGPAWYAGAGIAFSVTICAGVLLNRGEPLGRTLSTILQALQVVQFSAAGIVYQFSTGLELLAFVSGTELRISPGVRASFSAMPVKVPQPWFLAINAFAVLALVILSRPIAPKQIPSAVQDAA